jgi:hypothetical protein
MEPISNHDNEENETEKQSEVQADFQKEEIYIDPECYNDDLEEVKYYF